MRLVTLCVLAMAGIGVATGVLPRLAGAAVALRPAGAIVAVRAEPAPLSAHAPGSVFKDCADCPEMVVIPAGRFIMGADPGEEEREQLSGEFRSRSEPQRRVTVERFAAGRYEVTRGEYRVFATATGRATDGCFFWNGADWQMDGARSWRDVGYPQDDSHPVACTSWEDAAAYAEWLTRRTGKRYRLLSEAEWEYAARAGTTAARYWGEDGNRSCAYANTADDTALWQVTSKINWPVAGCNDGHAHTAPVGTFRPNAFGLHDMLGNVWEWTQDCWTPSYVGAPRDGSAWMAGDCGMRAVRGGSWDDGPPGVRAAYRVGSPVVIRVYGRGFRVARDE